MDSLRIRLTRTVDGVQEVLETTFVSAEAASETLTGKDANSNEMFSTVWTPLIGQQFAVDLVDLPDELITLGTGVVQRIVVDAPNSLVVVKLD